MDIKEFWNDVLHQNEDRLKGYFSDDAVICWHCTNELFTVSEYIRANCEYPGLWDGEIERVEEALDTTITAVRVFPAGGGASFHVVSFCKLKNGSICQMDEYWSEDEAPPEWRRSMNIGTSIR